jgi:hypothetical protein
VLRKASGENCKNIFITCTVLQISDQVKEDEGHVACMGEKRHAYGILVGKPQGKRPLGRPRRRQKDDIKMVFREIEWGDMDWINLVQDRDHWRALVNTVMNLRVL